MKFLTLCLILCALTVKVNAQSFTDNLYVFPVNNKLEGHRWSYRQGLDFDIVNHKATDGTGIHMYIGVNENTPIHFSHFIHTAILGEPVKLYEKCDGKVCQYTALVNTALGTNNQHVWVQIWLRTEKKQLDKYLDWLSTLSFDIKKP